MDVYAAVAAQPKTKRQIDILEITEIALVEPPCVVERAAPIQSRGSASAEDLGVPGRPAVGPGPMPFPPCPAGDVVAVAGTVEILRRVGQHHLAREARGRRFAIRGGEKSGQPPGFGYRIGIEQRQAVVALRGLSRDIVGPRESDIVRQPDQLHLTELPLRAAKRIVGAGVVHDDDVIGTPCLPVE